MSRAGRSVHSQGGKVSALAAAVDPRVKAVCLLDPVDVTVYTPQGPDYPSAVAAFRHMSRGVPLAVIGSGRAGDCVPKDSNYRCQEILPDMAFPSCMLSAKRVAYGGSCARKLLARSSSQ